MGDVETVSSATFVGDADRQPAVGRHVRRERTDAYFAGARQVRVDTLEHLALKPAESASHDGRAFLTVARNT
jgi:hypothetical protein